MSFHYTFFTESIRYLTACGQDPNSPLALASNSTCGNNSDNDDEFKGNLTWGILQSVVAFVLWVSCSLIGLRARRGSSALFPSTISLFMVVSMIAHGVASSQNWKLGFYGEVGCWGGAFLLSLLFYTFDLERVPLGSFVFVSIVGGICMIVEYITPGSFDGKSNLNNGELCAIFAVPLVVGALIGGFLCKKKRLHSGGVFSSHRSGLDEDGMFFTNGDDDGIQSVRYGGKGHVILHVLAGSVSQAFVVAPLVFAASKFEGCPAIWQFGECHTDSYDPALATIVSTFVGTAVIGCIVQCCWAYRSTRESDHNYVNPDLHNHFRNEGANDVTGVDLASRSILKGQSTPHLDNRWSKMAVQEGY